MFAGVLGGATLTDLFGSGLNTSTRWGGTAGVYAGVRGSRNTVINIEVNWNKTLEPIRRVSSYG